MCLWDDIDFCTFSSYSATSSVGLMRSLVAPKCVLSRLLEAAVEGSAPPQIARPARLEGGGDGTRSFHHRN